MRTVMRTLRAADFDTVHAGFVDAFSDYVVKLSPTREQLLEMLTRRGWAPEASIAEFDGDRIVAFTLNGIDRDRGYDSGTGVAPSHRRQQRARKTMAHSFDLLRERGCTQYVLEVIDTNSAAITLYRGLGFEQTRGLQCWSFDGVGAGTDARNAAIREEFRDVEPSWQNTTQSIFRARDAHVLLGDADGYAVLFPSNGDVAQLAVRRDARRRGIGTRLLHEAARIAGKPLRIMNVDERDDGIAAFLEAVGAKRTVRQLEMIRPL